jgi:hypothetical protein
MRDIEGSTDVASAIMVDSITMLELRYNLMPQDAAAWWKAHSRLVRIGRITYWTNIAGCAVLFAWSGSRLGWSQLSTAGLGVLGFAAGWCLGHGLTTLWFKALAEENARGPSGKAQFGAHVFHVGPDGVSEEGPSARHAHSWDAIDRLVETPNHLFVVVTGGFAYVVPKRNLEGAAVADIVAHSASWKAAWEERRRTMR